MDFNEPIEELKEHGPGVMIAAGILIIGQTIGFGIGFAIGWVM